MAKVLLIEDDIDLQKIYSEKLKSSNFSVIISLNATSALDYLQNEIPDLILLDIMMPGKMNGFEFLETVKKNEALAKIPVIIITNLDTEKAQALQIGATDYLIKSNISPSELVEKVKKYTS